MGLLTRSGWLPYQVWLGRVAGDRWSVRDEVGPGGIEDAGGGPVVIVGAGGAEVLGTHLLLLSGRGTEHETQLLHRSLLGL